MVGKGKNRLILLVNHWTRCNRKRMADYLKLAEKLESQGLSEIAASIKKACLLALQANDSLCEARNTLARHQNEPDQHKELD